MANKLNTLESSVNKLVSALSGGSQANTTTSNTTSTTSPNIWDIMKSTSTNHHFRTLNKQKSMPKKSPYDPTFAPVDGGADTCLLGQEFHIEHTYPHRTVDVMGYSNDLVTSGVPIGTGITLYEGPDGTQFLLQVHEGIIMSNDKTLFSTNQMCHCGHTVNDVPIRYGGSQTISTYDDQSLLMAYVDGLCCLQIRRPTQEELQSLPLITLTSEVPWCPQVGESDPYNGLVEQEDSHNHLLMVNKMSSNQKEPNWDKIQPCFGWKPIEVIKATYQNTTQLATNNARLPLREHYKSRFPALNTQRIHETIATDTFFSAYKSIYGRVVPKYMLGSRVTTPKSLV